MHGVAFVPSAINVGLPLTANTGKNGLSDFVQTNRPGRKIPQAIRKATNASSPTPKLLPSWNQAIASFLAGLALRFSVWKSRARKGARRAVDLSERDSPDYNLNVLPLLLPKRADHSVLNRLWRKTIYWARVHDRGIHGNVDRSRAENVGGKVVVLGGGAFGTAMATHVARKGNEVVMLLRDNATSDFINQRHINPKYHSEFDLPENLKASTNAKEVLSDCQAIIHAVPVQSSRKALEAIKEHIPLGVPIIAVSKGLELGSQKMMTQVISEAIERSVEENPVVVVSGPSFAKEIMLQRPTSVVAASSDNAAAAYVQRLIAAPYFRVSITDDIIGVEVAGALKNVLAIAAGICEGLGLGLNAMSALVCQGSAEIRWLATAMGARPETLAGLSGTGDILLTCYGNLSRNRTLGVRLGSGEHLQDILGSSAGVAEGAFTSKLVVELADRHRVLLPVLTAVARILSGDVSARKAVFEVMSLPPLSNSA